MECLIGIDIGGTNTKLGLIHNDQVIASSSIKTQSKETSDAYADELADEIKKLAGTNIISGIGIGAPNGNFYSGAIEHAPNLKWKGIIPLARMIEERTKVKTLLTNDANAAALGEMTYGGARGMKNFIMITLGTGLGSGIVVDGKLIYGNSGFAGELGQTIVVPDGRLCGCGRKGCLETYVSATGILRTAEELAANKFKSSHDIAVAAEAGDPVALRAFDETAKTLGIALANFVTFTSPEAIFLFGGLTGSKNLLMSPLKNYFESHLHIVYRDTVKILLSELSEGHAALLGAAALVKK